VDAREVMARLLRLSGYRAVTAADGDSALKVIESDPPDLVLLDLMMPHMNGLDVLRRLRSDERWESLPVVLFTAVSEGTLIEQAQQLGILGVVVKCSGGMGPFDQVAQYLQTR
jgi:CheY-like chemotaxis protein